MCDSMMMQSELIKTAIHAWEGDSDAAMHWLISPLSALNGQSPWMHAQSAEGFEEVKRLIRRIDYGEVI